MGFVILKKSWVVYCTALALLCLLAAHFQGNTAKTKSSSAVRKLMNNEGFVYANMATIVPDPFHAPVDEETRKGLTETYGKWHFWDGDADIRPKGDYCGEYPNRDIPGNDFPENAWQTDAVYVNHLINDAEELLERTIEAIYEEYGLGKSQNTDLGKLLADRMKMTHVHKIDFSAAGAKIPGEAQSEGGWTTARSFDGLVLRLLHAIMTNDTFTVVLGGHSAAAGHGNHFHQNYMMQFHKVLAPVFARLGVKLITRNMSQGGLGTIQHSMAMKDFYGDEIDLLLWDCGMTEGDPADIEYFFRQGLLSGKRVPVIWGGPSNVMQFLHEKVDADVGDFGNGSNGIPEVTGIEQAETIPWAARYMKCANEYADLCKANRFCATCWVDRNDIPRETFANIRPQPPSQVRWHPGWRFHQLKGRVLAINVLTALQAAIQLFSDGTMGGPPLDDSMWHVTDYYNNIREKLKSLDPSEGYCKGLEPRLPAKLCGMVMEGRGLYTPRVNPTETSLLNLIKPAPNGYKPYNQHKVLYEGPDVLTTCDVVKPGEADPYAVASNRRFLSTTVREPSLEKREDYYSLDSVDDSRRLGEAIVPGRGWQHMEEYPGECDGSYYTHCARHYQDSCPMLGHHDSRGYIAGNEFSGWLVLEIPRVEKGIIILKLYTWLGRRENHMANDWTSVNNERRLEEQFDSLAVTSSSLKNNSRSEWEYDDYVDDKDWTENQRYLKSDPVVFPDTFQFDFAINGQITTLDKDAFFKKISEVQRVVQDLTLLDDPNFGPKENVEVAIRLRGCGAANNIGVTHVYWA